MHGRFEYPLDTSSTKFFDEFKNFTTAIRNPDGNAYAIIITETEEADTFIRLRLVGTKNVEYRRIT